MTDGQKNIKLRNAKQAKRVYQYKNTKIKLYKNNAAIWYNKTCRTRQLTPTYAKININEGIIMEHVYFYRIKELCIKLVIETSLYYDPGQKNIKLVTTWYIWQGAIFQVPVSTLQRQKNQGGWDLIDIEAKCRALLLRRMWMQSIRVETATASWLKAWKLTGPQANPPNATRIPNRPAYLQKSAIDMAYVTPPGRDEAPNTYKRRLYYTLHPWQWRNEGQRK